MTLKTIASHNACDANASVYTRLRASLGLCKPVARESGRDGAHGRIPEIDSTSCQASFLRA